MAITSEKIEAFLIEAELPFEQVNEGMWIIHDENDYIDNIVLFHSDPVVTFRVKLMDAPENGRMELFTQLLELNATSMITGAYGLEEEAIVIVDTLQSENLDFNEFQASIDSIALAIREHYEQLKRFNPQHTDNSDEAEAEADAE